MNSELNLELYTEAMSGLNKSFEEVGQLIQDNIGFIASDEENSQDIDKIAIQLENKLDGFENSYNSFEEFYNEIIEDLQKEEVNCNEYEPFLQHTKGTFPQYISNLKESVEGMRELNIKNEKFNEALDEFEYIIYKIIATFEKILSLSSACLIDDEI